MKEYIIGGIIGGLIGVVLVFVLELLFIWLMVIKD